MSNEQIIYLVKLLMVAIQHKRIDLINADSVELLELEEARYNELIKLKNVLHGMLNY